jgi:hypothetical protein
MAFRAAHKHLPQAPGPWNGPPGSIAAAITSIAAAGVNSLNKQPA